MNLREHVILGGAAAATLYPVLGAQGSAVFWASSVLIDVDHYWEYLSRNRFRNWSFRKTFAFHRALFQRIRDPEFLGLNVFHTAEWFLLISLAGVWLGSSMILAAFWGMIFHLGLDLARLHTYGCLFKRALSVVEYVARRHRLVARGLNPDAPYEEALGAVNSASRPPVHVETLKPLNPHRTIPSGNSGQAVD